MGFLRRMLGRGGSDDPSEAGGTDLPIAAPRPDLGPEPEPAPAPVDTQTAPLESAPSVRAACPSCGHALDPPPERSRRCPWCHAQIVVRRGGGRPVLLTEDAVAAFHLERQRLVDDARWTADRDAWLRLAATVHADRARHDELASMTPSDAVVAAARDLYVTTADAAARSARKTKRWADLARIRRAQAAAVFHAAGSPVPPPDEIAALHREGMLAQLRALSDAYKDAELVGAGCCRACRVGDGKVFRIADEARTLRLPHDGCPKGLCSCDWFPAIPAPRKRRRTRRETPKPETVVVE